jgi:hypothetical protein
MHCVGICSQCRHGQDLLWHAWFSRYVLYYKSHLDCVTGVLLGALLWWVKLVYGDQMDAFITDPSWWGPISVMAITFLLVRIHPEPADACCKCFEDGVAFAGVFIGVKFGQWRNPAMHSAAAHGLAAAPVGFILLKMVVKIVLGITFQDLADIGVSILLAWRATTKPMLHRILPPFYRLLEKARLDMPRRYFMRASYPYTQSF